MVIDMSTKSKKTIQPPKVDEEFIKSKIVEKEETKIPEPLSKPTCSTGWMEKPITFEPRTVNIGGKQVSLKRPDVLYIEKYRYTLIYIGFNKETNKFYAQIDVVEQPFGNTTLNVPGVSPKENKYEVLNYARWRVDESIKKAENQNMAGGIPESQIPGGLPEPSEPDKPLQVHHEIYKGFEIKVFVQNQYMGTLYGIGTCETYPTAYIVVSDGQRTGIVVNDLKFKIDWYKELS